jgi:hypothetical protein
VPAVEAAQLRVGHQDDPHAGGVGLSHERVEQTTAGAAAGRQRGQVVDPPAAARDRYEGGRPSDVDPVGAQRPGHGQHRLQQERDEADRPQDGGASADEVEQEQQRREHHRRVQDGERQADEDGQGGAAQLGEGPARSARQLGPQQAGPGRVGQQPSGAPPVGDRQGGAAQQAQPPHRGTGLVRRERGRREDRQPGEFPEARGHKDLSAGTPSG